MLNRELSNDKYNECVTHSLSWNDKLPWNDKLHGENGENDNTDTETILSEIPDEWTTVKTNKRKYNRVGQTKFDNIQPYKKKMY